RLPLGEPWASIAFLLFAMAILVYRVRERRLEQRVIRAQSNAEALTHVARRFLAIRDLANTPLQTIEATAALLGEIPAARVHAARLMRSLERMQEWQRILGEDSQGIPWSDEDTAFDALSELRKGRQVR